MFSLMSGFYKYMFQKDEYFVLILGLDNAGKTTFLEQTKIQFCPNFKSRNLVKITSTVGLNIGKIDVSGVRLSFWDLGGQEELQSLWDKYYAESHAVIYVIDSSDDARIEESKNAFDEVLRNSALCGVPVLILANKHDLPDCVSMEVINENFRESNPSIISRLLKSLSISALNGDGVSEGIKWLVDGILKNSFYRPPISRSN